MLKNKTLTEDWTAVIIGLVLILLNVATTFFSEMPKFGPKEGWSGWTVLSTDVFTTGNSIRLLMTFLYFLLFAGIGAWLMGKNIKALLIAFPIIFILSMGAQFIAASGSMKNLGLETVLFSLLIGLFISNVLKTPKWLKEGIQSEFYIKVGLVMLGSTILFSEIMKAGVYGLIQAIIIVVSVWYFAYWIAKKLKVDEELGIILASAVSICGVSAAIATAGAIKGDSKKLSYVISLVLIVAIPMMIFMPLLAKWMGLTDEVTGAWLGGSIDTTGAVVASGTIAGETALKFSTIIKFSQNVLLGVAAFLISIFWTYRQASKNENDEKPSMRVIWERFPKFVLGFIFASIVFSFFISPETAVSSGKTIKSYQSLWFNLAFICIGMETRFKDLISMQRGRPLYAFLIAQVFNIILTLIVAYIIFGMLWSG
ncbi:MAG: putative sulfate exporter family transporter [Bacteroidales bacterium]|nr:putative sulfate exporter family transporter [Bacteroidales bacterium]MDZ4205089.1 putative sulfate exporter family transporter [Bacteroidales bacterium]